MSHYEILRNNAGKFPRGQKLFDFFQEHCISIEQAVDYYFRYTKEAKTKKVKIEKPKCKTLPYGDYFKVKQIDHEALRNPNMAVLDNFDDYAKQMNAVLELDKKHNDIMLIHKNQLVPRDEF